MMYVNLPPAPATAYSVQRSAPDVARALQFSIKSNELPEFLLAQAAPPTSDTMATPARGDMTGNWQGTVDMGKSIRTVLKLTKGDKGWTGKLYLFGDQGAQAFDASAIVLDGSTFKFAVSVIGGTYLGTLSPDGNTITGELTGGPKPTPLVFVRATKETAWEIPAPPPPVKLMAADADPAFDVATIKPNNSGATQMQGLTVNGRNFATRNSSVGDLIAFAYGVQMKQIVGAPDWLEKERYDIAAVPDKDGAPNPAQVRLMIKKLLADRFKLMFHQEKRELSAFVLTVGKGGSKLKPTELSGPLPGIGFRPAAAGITMSARNATIADFTGFLQQLVLDRPVVDRTGLTAKYDFSVMFTPDDSQFNGHPPPLPQKTDSTEPFPALFPALQEQLGLKMDAEKTQVDVIAVDHLEKPSAN